MEFEEMKKIWDSQNNETLYVVNEEVMHRAVKTRKKKASKLVGINEVGLILINLIVGSLQLYEGIIGGGDLWDILMGTFMFAVIGYIVYLRLSRKKEEEQFDRSMLGELDHAMHNTQSLMKIGRTMVWWYMAPIGVMVFSRLIVIGAAWHLFLLIAGLLLFGTFISQWEVRRCHSPRLHKLQELRNKLLEEV